MVQIILNLVGGVFPTSKDLDMLPLKEKSLLCGCGYNISRCNLVKHKVSKRRNDIMRALNNPLAFQQICKN